MELLRAYASRANDLEQAYERYMPLVGESEHDAIMSGVSKRRRGRRNAHGEDETDRRKRVVFRTLMIGLIVGFAAVVVLVYAISWIRRRKMREKARESKMRACASETPGDTIFVCVTNEDGSADCAHSLRSMFANAKCPSRVFAGVVYRPDDERCAGNPVSAYLTLTAQYNDPFVLSDHVRALRLPARPVAVSGRSGNEEDSSTRLLAEKHLFKGERYVLYVRNRTMFCIDWDRLLIDQLSQCADTRAVLTCPPTMYLNEDRHSVTLNAAAPPHFPYLLHISPSGTPVFAIRPCLGKPNRPFPVNTFTYSFAFTRSEHLREMLSLRATLGLSFAATERDVDLDDACAAAMVWVHGWNFYAPTALAVYASTSTATGVTSSPTSHSEGVNLLSRLLGRLGGVNSLRDTARYQQHTGLRLHTRKATPHALLGLTNEATNDEIICKYRSLTEYYNALRAAGGDVTLHDGPRFAHKNAQR